MAQAEQLKQQTLATLSERDQQMRQLAAMLEEARAQKPKVLQERFQREVGVWKHIFLDYHGIKRLLFEDLFKIFLLFGSALWTHLLHHLAVVVSAPFTRSRMSV